MGILRGAGIDHEGGILEDTEGRVVVTKSGLARYLESNLWKDIDDELRDPNIIAHGKQAR